MTGRSIGEGSDLVLRRGMAEFDWYISVPARQPAIGPAVSLPQEGGFSGRLLPWQRRLLLAGLVLAGFWALLLAFQGAFKGFQTNGISMEPGLHSGDRVIVNKIAYAQLDLGILDGLPLVDISARWNTPSRGDVVILESPVHPGRELIKRVIGLPGETVQIKNGLVYINGAPLEEPYAAGRTLCTGECLWVVPAGRYFVLGDNRMNSSDSRDGWTVAIDDIDGQKVLTY